MVVPQESTPPLKVPFRPTLASTVFTKREELLLPPRVWHAQNGRVHVSQVQLHATGDGDLRGFSEEDTTEELKRKFEIEGQTEFILAAIRNSDLRFETFKADPDIKTVWTSKNPMGVTPAPAVKFGRKIIRATNEFHHLVSPTPTMVSAESDCSLMNPSRGFDWLK